MASRSMPWPLLLIISTLVLQVSGRHVHRKLIHQHLHQREADTSSLQSSTIVSAPPSPTPSVKAADAVLADIQDIKKGLDDLPADLMSFILSIENRLQKLEALLAGLLQDQHPSPVSPVGPILPTNIAALSRSTSDGQGFTVSQSASAESAYPQTTSTKRITRTQTTSKTVTWHIPVPTGALHNSTSPRANGTALTLPSPFPTPWTLLTSAAAPSTTVVVVTRTLEYISSDTASSSGNPSSSTPAIPTTAASRDPDTSPTPYVFNANAADNVAVYYGTTPATKPGGLLELCQNPNTDIVILSFVFSLIDDNGFPSIDFGPGCSGPRVAQKEQAPGLKDCSVLATEIAGCQAIGMKVLISLGGYNADTKLVSDDQATKLASTLWDLFGAGTSLDPDLRPFGPGVVIDGFDIDNENHDSSHYTTFATALRQHFETDKSKTYYLSAAPQCPLPDESIPMGVLAQADFVWVQFYNNPSCNLDGEGFENSFKAWASALSSSTQGLGPKLYIGAAAFEGAGSGYASGSALATRVSLAGEAYAGKFGGMMLWDGSEALANVDAYGVDYLEYAKAALH